MKFEFIKKVISSSNEASSKRFNGTIGFLMIQSCIVAASVLELILTDDHKLTELMVGLLKFDLIVCATLLGLGSLTDKIKPQG